MYLTVKTVAPAERYVQSDRTLSAQISAVNAFELGI